MCLQSECVCKTGYMGNGIVCDLINPCLRQNGGCHQLVNTHTHACTHTHIDSCHVSHEKRFGYSNFNSITRSVFVLVNVWSTAFV